MVGPRTIVPNRRTALALLGLTGAVVGAGAWYLWPTSVPAPVWAADYEVTARPPETIAPGTVVGSTPPEGWSHLVVKSLPRVRPGTEAIIPAIARSQTVRTTRWMFTAFAADVRPETRGNETRYHLRAIGLGLGTSVGDRDVIITQETAADHGVRLDWITRQIITKGYEIQRLAVVVVHGPTFAVLDTPVWFRCGGGNKLIRYRYALLVDAPSGRLDVVLWPLDPGGCFATLPAVRVAPNAIDAAELVPDPKGFDALGLASDSTFGVDRLPTPNTPVTLPADLRPLAERTRFTADDARELEAALRALPAGSP